MKKFIVGSVAIALVLGGVFVLQKSTNSQLNDNPVTATTAPIKPAKVNEFHLMRYKPYNDIESLKQDAHFIIVADYIEKKRVYEKNSLYFTESVFNVKKVLKGDKELKGTNIIVTETGAVLGDVIHVPEGDELLSSGRYLLFMDKAEADVEIPYDQYYIKGVFSGKFKLENGKVKGYGTDDVRKKAETINETTLLKSVE